MLNLGFKNFFSKQKTTANSKILTTLFLLFLFRFGNTIPISGIDQEALRKSFFQLENKTAILQIINLFGGGEKATLISPFSLGIIPFINASILIDLLTAASPNLEKLQSEEGEIGRQKLLFYKKIATLIFATIQSSFLAFYIQSYFYVNTPFVLTLFVSQLVTGSLVVVWLTNLIDKKGIGNGTSLFILFNIIVSSQNKNIFQNFEWNSTFLLECFVLLVFIFLISISQFTNVTIPVVSARQLKFLEKEETRLSNTSSFQTSNKTAGLLIRFNQAGIFPIIIASNLLPFLASNNILKPFLNIIYYLIILGFNYFYTTIFWDPEKIAEQLRKASVSIANIRPGKATISYLENIAFRTSIIGGIFLCVILFLYDCVKIFIQGSLLSQINISSLIIVVGICFELQKTIKTLYKNKS